MASPNTAPAPTPEAPVHPWDGAEPNIEEVPKAPQATHESVIDLDPNSKLSISEQIENDAQARGFDNLNGLRLDVNGKGDEAPQSFVVRSTSIHKEPIKVEHAVGLPRFRGGITTFGRPTKRTVYKKVGLPRFVKYGSIVSFERREERIGDKDVPYVTVDTYDENGIHTGVKSIRQQDLFANAGEHGVTQASWSERAETPPDTGKDLPIGLSPGKKSRFEQITSQLEDNGVTNWTGLRWQREDPRRHEPALTWDRENAGPRKSKYSPRRHKGHNEQPAPVVTQEIVSDASIKEKAFNGKDDTWSRVFLLRTTTEGAGGKTDVEEVRLRDYELWQYLEDEREGLPIRDMRMPGVGTRPRHDAIARDAWDSDQAWGGLVPKNHERQAWVDAPHQHAMPHVKDALGMLSFPEMHMGKYGLGDEGKEMIQEYASKLGMKRSEQRYAQELQRAIGELGRERVDAVVADIYNTYLESLERLGLEGAGPQLWNDDDKTVLQRLGPKGPEGARRRPPVDGEDAVLGRIDVEPGQWDYSDSWILRDLMKKRVENAAENMKPDGERTGDVWDPLGDTPEARQFRRDLIDTRIGRRFTAASTKLSDPRPTPTGEVRNNQPVVKAKRQFIYDNRFETTIPILTNYGQRNMVAKWRGKVWEPTEKQAEAIYRQIAEVPLDSRDEPLTVEDEEYRKLGRGLRRTIGL